ncbi:MAG: 2-C-methyl-D-erythritol 4-phosphate cytidylyltransferase [Ruminococcaceae bacterium]|nr:2-C-methyl-D-erythritol 4-phosphate cytidylyltransferase [Oscillospiraceae bacterium]
MSTIAILTAAGSGTRTHQDIPKQFIHVDNKPIIVYTLEAFQQHPNIDEICVVILDGWEKILSAYAKQFNISKLKYVVKGGDTGQESIYNGLEAIRNDHEDTDIVMIHDGNRAMVSQDIITDSIVKQRFYGSAVASIPCTEVVFVSDNGLEAENSIPRETLQRTQTPHTYYLGELWDAHQQARERGIKNMAASCSLMAQLGKKIYFSKGSEKNIKITTVEDLEIFQALLHAKNDSWIK